MGIRLGSEYRRGKVIGIKIDPLPINHQLPNPTPLTPKSF